MQRKQEAKWRSLFVNKINKRRSRTNKIAAHAKTTKNLIVPSPYQETPGAKKDFIYQDTSRLFVSSWNVGGIAPPEDLVINDWLDIQNHKADIYVLGFQEIVPLNAKNILGLKNKMITQKWNRLIEAALNKTVTNVQQTEQTEVAEFKKVFPLGEDNCESRDFQCIMSKKMVGIFISVWVRSDIRCYIRHMTVSCVGCGIMGCLGNKGAVSVRFLLHETSFCFVCCHLASGGKKGDERYRNADAAEILSHTSFPRGPLHTLPTKILDHNRVIWLGDLNYRIYLPEATTRSLVRRSHWSILLQNDQLKAEFQEGHVFDGWHEKMIEFAPTYKYNPDSDEYYSTNKKGKGKKLRSPAWCDRIIWFGKGLKQNHYSRGEYKLSDHRPVQAIFTAEVRVLRRPNIGTRLVKCKGWINKLMLYMLTKN